MHIAIATDIFGVNDSVREIASVMESAGSGVSIISPYESSNLQFCSEEDAFSSFIDQCGHEEYCRKVAADVLQKNCQVILGFSAGASAAWLACAMITEIRITHCIGFYPTRIRKYLHKIPQVPVTLIFPQFEKNFSLDDLIRNLCDIDNICCLRTPYQHGFLNPYSNNHAPKPYNAFVELLGLSETLSNPSLCRRKFLECLGAD